MRIFKRKGSPHWWASWYDKNGRRHRKSTGVEDKGLAQALSAKWQQAEFMEQHFGAIPAIPFRDALLRYAEAQKRQNEAGYQASGKYRLQYLLDRFGSMNLTDITFKALQEFASERAATAAPATVRRDLVSIRAILNREYKIGHLAAVPPMPSTGKGKVLCRWLTSEEERRLLAAAKPHIRLLIAFAVDTGGRKGELFKLDWRDVNLTRKTVMFRNTKNGEDRSVRLTQRALAILLEIGPKEAGPVFTYRGRAMGDVKHSFNRARQKAGIEKLRFHDLRHTFASRLVQRGVPLYEVMHLTGHKSFSMVQRYAHLAPDYQARAIEALDAFGTNWAQPNAPTASPEGISH
jgi:integrase